MRAALAFLWLVMPAAWGLEFRPVVMTEHGEGDVSEYLQLSNQGRPITYRPPSKWLCRGVGNVLHLTPSSGVEAGIEIRVLPPEKVPSASGENLKAFEDLAVASLPKEATKIETISITLNPIEISGHRTIETVQSYVLFGRSQTVTQLFLPRERDLWRFTVVARTEDREALRQAFYASLHTLAGL